eukprot:9738996-Karenia_brevis.AAC.1
MEMLELGKQFYHDVNTAKAEKKAGKLKKIPGDGQGWLDGHACWMEKLCLTAQEHMAHVHDGTGV